MNEEAVYQRIAELKIVPVVAIESVDAALPLADALIAGGLPVAEITFRTACAADVIALLAKERPALLVGAGTVVTAENAQQAKAAGASFAVAPGLNPNTVRAAAAVGLPFSPGVMTPSNVETALELGVCNLKFFPAGAAGGVPMLKSLAAPYKHLGVKFIPTGGISLDNVQDYLSVPQVIAAGGTWLATQNDIADGNWDAITAKCKAVVDLVR
jgi:2-dehydro-3-deoxyphosphogluconate aldolase/(4S)-4-hydroxy-2-oxoglutarate aldolase